MQLEPNKYVKELTRETYKYGFTVLLTSPLEYTNEPYAIAKIAGLKLCESFNLQYGTNYIAVMPTIYTDRMIISIWKTAMSFRQ